VLGLEQESYVGCLPPCEVPLLHEEAFAANKERHCAQKLALDVAQRTEGEGLCQFIASLVEELKNRSSWMESKSGISRQGTKRNDPPLACSNGWCELSSSTRAEFPTNLAGQLVSCARTIVRLRYLLDQESDFQSEERDDRFQR